MPIYQWVGKTLSGEVRRGEMEAADAKLVEARLRRLQIIPLKIQERRESALARFRPKKVEARSWPSSLASWLLCWNPGCP